MTGTFVALEGTAGTGKSTLLDALADELRERGESVTTVPEFADGSIGEFVVDEIVSGDAAQFRERALSLTAGALASVSYQAETEIRPALDEGEIVLTERFLDSVAVYDTPFVAEREGVSMEGALAEFRAAMPVEPDLTVLLTVDEETHRERLAAHRPELLDDGAVPDRRGERERRYRDLLADREDALVYDNSGDVSTAVAEIAAEIER
ncbi:dTMP kinase [Halosimplex pelagicum]|uniref:dTMP kinase n=1 Tax=Halosimplex pelagicum TaxID=869886 RepID=A0A7D5T395_9EURY|nr:AAA family ATPase [Halosimplex pelagicum]QLH80548.1 AAA family ATPase [Halosimplex pelagicum]